MESFAKFLSATLVALTLIACQNKSANNNNGGIDGSGGNLFEKDFAQVNRYLKGVKPELKMLTNRLRLIEKHLDGKYQSNTDDLVKKYLGSDQQQLDNLVDSMSFNLVDHPCNADAGNDRDAAVDSNGKVCINYKAFKSFESVELEKSLIALMAHELAHLRGFGEADAQLIQGLVYSDKDHTVDRGFVGLDSDHFLLFDDENFWQFDSRMRDVVFSLDSATELLFKGEVNSVLDACTYLVSLVHQPSLVELSLRALPSYIQRTWEDSVSLPIHESEGIKQCLLKSPLEVSEEIKIASIGMTKLLDELAEYKSGLCRNSNCLMNSAGSGRPEDFFNQYFQVKSKYVFTEQKPVETAIENVSCEIQNNLTKEVTKFTAKDGFKFRISVPGTIHKDFFFCVYISKKKADTAVQVDVLGDTMTFNPISNQGFVFNSLRLGALLQKGSVEFAATRFTMADANGFDFNLGRVWGSEIEKVPTPVADFQMNCSVN